MEITINVGDIDLDTVLEMRPTEEDGPEEYTLRDAVVDKIVRDRLMLRLSTDASYELTERIGNVRAEIIRELITPMLQEAVARDVQPTNIYGEPSGPAISLREVIVKEAKETLQKKGDYGRGKSLVEKVIAEEVDRALTNELREDVKAAKLQARKAVQEKAAELLAAVAEVPK